MKEFADTLVRDHGVPFRTAHHIAAKLIAARQSQPAALLSALVAEASRELLGSPLTYSDASLADILSPRHFVDVRETRGGPAPPETARAIAASRQLFERDHAACLISTDALKAAERRLSQRSRSL